MSNPIFLCQILFISFYNLSSTDFAHRVVNVKGFCFISDVIEMEDLKLVIDCNLQFISMQDFTTLRHSQY